MCSYYSDTMEKMDFTFFLQKKIVTRTSLFYFCLFVFTLPEKAFIRKIALALSCHPRMGTRTLLYLWIKKGMQLSQLSELDCTEDPHLDSCATSFLSHGKQLAEKKFVSPFLILCSSSALTFANLSSSSGPESLRNQKHVSLYWTTEWGENHCRMRKHSLFFFLFYLLDTEPQTEITTLIVLLEKLG